MSDRRFRICCVLLALWAVFLLPGIVLLADRGDWWEVGQGLSGLFLLLALLLWWRSTSEESR